MKKSIVIVIVFVIIGLGVWLWGAKTPSTTPTDTTGSATTVSAPVSEVTKISDKLTQYKNDELGFSVNYPSAWEKTSMDSGDSFVIPQGKPDSTTIGKLESKIVVTSGKCAFPPVTTIKDRSTIKSGTMSFNTISMSNSVKGINYFDRMYSLDHNNICYMFSFSSINTNPANKGFKGSEATVIANNNKAVIDSADQAFAAVVKSFQYTSTPAGQDEASVVPVKK